MATSYPTVNCNAGGPNLGSALDSRSLLVVLFAFIVALIEAVGRVTDRGSLPHVGYVFTNVCGQIRNTLKISADEDNLGTGGGKIFRRF